ncbi:MAG: two-component regulator propeller domain-containing protein [Candidatus Omnitrophota bacterium]
MKKSIYVFRFFFAFLICLWGLEASAGIKDDPFVQEYHEAYPIPGGDSANDVRAIAIDGDGTVWAGTQAGLFALRGGAWSIVPEVEPGPVYELQMDRQGVLWVGAWNGVYRISDKGIDKTKGIQNPIGVIGLLPDDMIAIGPDGSWRWNNGQWQNIASGWSLNARDAALDGEGALWIATGVGLYRWDEKELDYYFKDEELTYSETNALAFAPDGKLWIGELGGIDVYQDGKRIRSISGRDGLPYHDVRALAFDADGTLWIGTGGGVARYDGLRWSQRHSRRWLLSDDVRALAIAPDGAAWIATAKGVSAIKRKTMTLAEKEAYFRQILGKRHIRPPGFVEKCYFPNPADRSVFEPYDDDNDGQYTSMYMAMESLRFAVTKNPEAKDRADRAYDALERLQTITQTGSFVARTIVPSDWKRMADSNEAISPQEAAERRLRDPRYKPMEKRWRLSADGKWLWKGDTSSDEITGHFFGYYFYYKLAADDAHKSRVRDHVRKIMDGIIRGGYVLRDIDGQPTRWGVWSPEKLNHDPDWRVERPINSFEILSYLKTAYFITGDEKYQNEFKKLIEKHGYLDNCRRPKSYGRSDRTHIDDELLALAAPGLMLNEDDPQLRTAFLEGLTWAYKTIENENDPFYNFIYGLVGGEDCHPTESVDFLRDQSLDLIQWTVDNSQREDVRLVRFPMVESLQIDRMLPASERGVMRWDKNPWSATAGDIQDTEGHFESCGVFWLLPYWLGRYAGFIE